ncbi:MAG: hypothetical protein K0U12_01245, partial [Gammaproteobacteria bacterium]|nr:hypothetical protein [Gammaproteobacteria bacterium]
MSKKKSISPEEKDQFRQYLQGVKPLRPNQKHHSEPLKPSVRPRPQQDDYLTPAKASLPSMNQLLDHLDPSKWRGPEDSLQFHQSGVRPTQLRKLRQGKLKISAKLDLHGLIVEEAEQELACFLETCPGGKD